MKAPDHKTPLPTDPKTPRRPDPLPPKAAVVPPVQPARGPFELDPVRLRGECTEEFLRSGGPGGQHRNKVETGVRLKHPPSGIVITATEHRSQRQNRDAALERLIEKLRALNQPKRRRKPTRKSKGSERRRLEGKRQRSETKQARGSRHDD